MPVLARDHHPGVGREFLKRHGLNSLDRKPGSGHDQSPLPVRKAPLQIERVAPGQAKFRMA